MIAIAALLALGEIEERMAKPPAFTLSSNKAPELLEFCVGDAISTMAETSAFREGPSRSVVVGFGFGKAVAVVDMRTDHGHTTLTAWILGKGWDDRMRAAVAKCL